MSNGYAVAVLILALVIVGLGTVVFKRVPADCLSYPTYRQFCR